jgi:hypothetical protein
VRASDLGEVAKETGFSVQVRVESLDSTISRLGLKLNGKAHPCPFCSPYRKKKTDPCATSKIDY